MIFIIVITIAPECSYAGLAPLSREFLKKNQDTSIAADSQENINTGYFHAPVDLNHLASNPPDVKIAADIPSSFDLRTQNKITPAKDQWQWMTSWAFAAISAMESSYLISSSENDIDLSEFHLAWFSRFNPDRRKTFTPYGERLEQSYTAIEAGNELMAVAVLARLDSPVNEDDMLAYPDSDDLAAAGINPSDWYSRKDTGKIPTYETMYEAGLIPSRDNFPEDYGKPKIRLTDALYASPAVPGRSLLDPYEYNFSSDIISQDDYNIIKDLIINYGAVEIAYHSNSASSEYLSSPDKAYFYNVNSSSDSETSNIYANNTVVIAGWDDNYSREHFNETMRPEKNGAWLIKTSWPNLETLDDGYFWMSYEQPIELGLAYVTETMPDNLKHYGHDYLGWCNSYGFENEDYSAWAANVFKITSEGEKLESIAFYTTDNNCEYEYYIYDLGTSQPRTPTNGDLIISGDGIENYAGYHTLKLDDFAIDYGHYFSVVMKFITLSFDTPIAVELKISGYSDFAVAHDGESYFSSDGNAWIDGAKVTAKDPDDSDITYVFPMNACIKAFTIAPNPISGDNTDDITVNNIPLKNYPAVNNSYNITNDSGQSEQMILILPGVSPDININLYFVDRTAVNEITTAYTEFYDDYGEYELHPQKGLLSLEEWAYYPTMIKGYLPDQLWTTGDGIEYPVYGLFRETAKLSGDILINVRDLRYQDNGLGHIPSSNYYRIIYSPDIPSDNFTNEIGEIALSASDPSYSQTSSSSSNGTWRSRNYKSCNMLNIFGMPVIILAMCLIFKKR